MKRVGIAILGLGASLFAQDNLGLWAKYKTISINTKASGANVANNVTKFPVLVRLDSVNAPDVFAASGGAKAGGADIRFANAAGAQKPFEIEHWDGVAKKAAIWVLADTVKGNDSVAALRLYWGNSSAVSASGKSVFDTANGFVGAWHFGNGSGNVRPASVLGAHSAFVNNGDSATAVTGLIGKADTLAHKGVGEESDSSFFANRGTWIDLNRDANGASAGASSQYNNFATGLSYSIWVRPTTAAGFARLLVMAPDPTVAADRAVFMANGSNGAGDITVRWSSGCSFGSGCSTPAGQVTTGAWHQVYFTKASGSNGIVVYLNGNKLFTTPNASDLTLANRLAWIGRAGDNNPFYTGLVDNVTLARVSHDSNYVKLSYQTQKAAANAVVVGGTVTQPQGPDTSAENYSTWTKNRSIWLNTGSKSQNSIKIGANVRNFPVLVRFAATDTAYTQAKAGGADLRFAKANGTTALPYQIEQWNSNGAAVWVLVDTVKANDSTQTIRMLWGNAAANSRSNGAAVFSTANGFASVWHLNDSTTQASANGQGPTATASTPAPTTATPANSLIGGAKVFNGSTNWYQVGADSTALNLNTNLGPYTLSGWVNAASCDARIAVISKYSNSNDIAGRQYALHTANTTTTWRFTNGAPALTGNGDAEFAADAADACVAGTWTYVVGTYRSAAAPTADSAVNAKLYVNGVLAASGATSGITGTSLGNVSQAYIGRIATNERYMNGTLDEVRVHSVARDSNWIKLEYGNQRANQTLTLLAKPVYVGINGMASMSAMGLSVKSLSSGVRFRVDGLAAGDKAVLNLMDMFGRTVYGASFSGEGLTWNGMNNNGQAISTGVYFARVKILDAKGQLRKVLEHKIPLAR